MTLDQRSGNDVVADFWDWYQRRENRRSNSVESHALDKCEEAFEKSEWDRFGYWHAIYLRERHKTAPARRNLPLNFSAK
jgi:hypothetical protein